MKTKLHFFFLISILSLHNIFAQTPKAKYSVVFTSVWNSSDHGTLPGNAHWSRLVGATHKTTNAFLEMGKPATTGIKDVAERGNNTVFNSEVTTAITNNEADQYINGNSLGSATGSITISDLIVDKDYPLISLASMIAPSPGWIVAINSIDLLDGSGNWKTSIVIDLFPYDAGTDSGTSYTSSNFITNPVQNISSLKGVSPFNNNKIGTLTITLTETLSLEKFKNDNSISIFYNKNSESIQIKDVKKRFKKH